MADFIATEALFIDGVRAHNPGDVVPAPNVKAHGWEGSVAREGTKAAVGAVASDETQSVSAQAPPPK